MRRGDLEQILKSRLSSDCTLQLEDITNFNINGAFTVAGSIIGVGVANYVEGTGRGPFEPVSVRVAENGRIHVASGGAILPERTRIVIRVLEADKRPVSAVADQREVRDVASVEVAIDRTRELTLLFDPEHALDERITMEQFIA